MQRAPRETLRTSAGGVRVYLETAAVQTRGGRVAVRGAGLAVVHAQLVQGEGGEEAGEAARVR